MTNTAPAEGGTTHLSDRLARELSMVGLTDIPRRFALREYHEDSQPSLYLWGVELPTGALGFLPDGTPFIEAQSAHRIRHLFGRVHDLDLIWLDEPAPAC